MLLKSVFYFNKKIEPRVKKLSILLMLVYLTSVVSLAQNSITVKGRVLDQDSVPLPFVHIYIPDIILGTVTNIKGEFKLTINDNLIKDSLLISSIGYQAKTKQIENIKNKDITIILNESEYILSEVVVRPDFRDSARTIMLKALSRLKKNYSTKLYYIDGFYREVNYKDSLAIRLIEAAIRINSKSYKFDKESLSADKLKIDVVQIRKSDDYRIYSVWDKVFKIMFGDQNNLYKVFQKDIIRYLDKKSGHFLNKYAVEKVYDYNIDNIIVNNRDTIYVIKSIYRNRIQTRSMKFYINKTDWAFIKFEEGVNFNKEISISNEMRDKLLIMKSTVHYSNYRGKYYLSFIDITDLTSGDGFLNFGELQFSKMQLMVNNVFIKGDKEFEKIKKKEVANQNQNLYSVKQKYDEKFWGNYNMIIYAPLKSNIITDLEREKPLEKQFRDNN